MTLKVNVLNPLSFLFGRNNLIAIIIPTDPIIFTEMKYVCDSTSIDRCVCYTYQNDFFLSAILKK